jgi:uncharacterized protein YbcI
MLGGRVLSLHTDISTRSGESIIVFTLSGDPEERLVPALDFVPSAA